MGKWERKILIINMEIENLGREAYVKIFKGMELLGQKRESEDIMLNDTTIQVRVSETLEVEV